MSKLYVDDFRDPPDDSWTLVRKVQPAIKLIASFDFEVISLDHDIENRPDDETFQPVAYFIGQKYSRRGKYGEPPKIIIHSVNPSGAKEIYNILKDYGINSEIKPVMSDLEFKAKYGL